MSLSVRRNANGSLTVNLDAGAAMLLRDIPRQLRALLSEGSARDKLVTRLFPRAHDDPEEEAEYRRLVGDELVQRKLDCVRVFEETLERASGGGGTGRAAVRVVVKPSEFDAWLGFVNDLRLVLGTLLDITEDGWERNIPSARSASTEFFLLGYLSELEELLLRAHGRRPRSGRGTKKKRPPPEGE